MELDLLYSEIIMEHNQNTHNKRHLESPDVVERGHNPSCGDDISLELKYDGDTILDASYTGIGCAISQASASMMIDMIVGKTITEALDSVNLFLGMIKKEVTDDAKLEDLGDAISLKNISNMPARVKCAVLAWHSLKEAIIKKQTS